jgi:hypothetical protein
VDTMAENNAAFVETLLGFRRQGEALLDLLRVRPLASCARLLVECAPARQQVSLAVRQVARNRHVRGAVPDAFVDELPDD